MLDGVDETARLAVAMKLVRYPNAPREILMMLATDIIEVAELVLSRAHFGEADLLHLVETADAERRQILAERRDLPAAVAARLGVAPAAPQGGAESARAVHRGQPDLKPAEARAAQDVATAKGDVVVARDTTGCVAKNATAGIAYAEGAKAVAAAAAPPAFDWEKPLGLTPLTAAKPAAEPMPAWRSKAMTPAATAPMPPPRAPKPAAEPMALPAWLNKPASAAAAKPATVATTPNLKPTARPMALPTWMTKSATPASAQAPAAAPVPAVAQAPAQPELPARRPIANAADTTVAITELEQAALQRKPEDFIDRLAAMLDLDRTKAEEVVRDPTGQSVAIACRALDMPCDVFSRIMLFLDPTIGRSVALVFSLAEYYGRLSVAQANDVVATWRGTKRPAARHVPVTAADGPGRHSFEPRRVAPAQPGGGRIAARG
ncbi:transcriptional regulatory protein algP [Blastochloris viridis]|nr:transcriptional regulatory protein algP [Blastochloris viridis]